MPDLLSDKDYDPDRQMYAAAEDHATHLRDAERLLNDVLNLVGLMLAAIGDDCDSRAMQSEIALKIIEKKVQKTHRRVDPWSAPVRQDDAGANGRRETRLPVLQPRR